MKKVITIVVLAAVVWGAWYLAAPLFIDEEVNESLEDAFVMPTDEELANMSEEELEAIEDEVHEAAANMPDKVMEEEMPENAAPTESILMDRTLISTGNFEGADSFHQGSGNVLAYQFADGRRIIRLEDFRVTNGPDLRVLLSKSTEVVDGEYIELGKLKGNVGNQNYEAPGDTVLHEYSHVIIYCKPFHVTFATAELLQ